MTCYMFLLIIPLASSFNISPNPNIIIRKPPVPTNLTQDRSSYFGFTINLRRQSIIVGAPRAQSTLETQKDVFEPGALFKCDLQGNQTCRPFNFDIEGNTMRPDTDFEYSSEKKDFQLLGMAMDGHEDESDRFVVCAPQLKADASFSRSGDYLLHGICYWAPDTQSEQPSGVRKVVPLRLRDLQTTPGDKPKNHNYFYMYGESGFSVHITDDNEEIIIGCPGILNWQGSIIRHHKEENYDTEGRSRREINEKRSHRVRKRQTEKYKNDIPSPYDINHTDDSYFGYAVSSAKFLGSDSSKTYYVASAPRSANQTGEVFIFEIEHVHIEKRIKVHKSFTGLQMGEYFGYALMTEDFNNDGLPDLVVSAPYFSKDGDHEHGAVYEIKNEGKLNFHMRNTLTSDYEVSGRFGTTLSKLGDINQDGYNDIAISAPFEGNGAVYIFLGGPEGLSTKPSQRIAAPSEIPSPFPGEESMMFGHGISRGVDIDSNGYRDIAIGAPNSQAVYVFKTYPVVKVIGSIIASKNELSYNDTSFEISVCVSINTSKIYDFEISAFLNTNYSISFSETKVIKNSKTIQGLSSKQKCWDETIFLKKTFTNVSRTVSIELQVTNHKNSGNNSDFCETCVTLDPKDLNQISTNVSFVTGCAEELCKVDLSVNKTLTDNERQFILGSSRNISIRYNVTNLGEPAFNTRLRISIPTNMTEFLKFPSNCDFNVTSKAMIVCLLNDGLPLTYGDNSSLIIVLSAEQLKGKSLTVVAEAMSDGNETKPEDNRHNELIPLRSEIKIGLVGQSSFPKLSLNIDSHKKNLTFSYTFLNKGKSLVRSILVKIYLPTIFNSNIESSQARLPLVDSKTISKHRFHENVRWIEEEIQMSTKPTCIDKDRDFISDKMTIFDCTSDNREKDCTEIKLMISDFEPRGVPVKVSINFDLSLSLIAPLLQGKQKEFVFQSSASIQNADDDDLDIIPQFDSKNPYTMVEKEAPPTKPWYTHEVTSSFFSIFLLILICVVLAKLGFFERKKKQELKNLKRESNLLTSRIKHKPVKEKGRVSCLF